MLFNAPTHTKKIGNGSLALEFNANNTLHAIRVGNLMVSQFETPTTQNAISNIFLREHNDGRFEVTPLLFSNADIETFELSGNRIGWKTTTDKWTATVIASVAELTNTYFYQVEVSARTEMTYDLVYGQDMALADTGAVKTNEAYCCQYLDHQVFNADDTGYTVCSRQNLPQSSGNPMIQLGSMSKVIAYSTDGYQFFGNQYKVDQVIPALQQQTLCSEKYQYEMAYIALQTEAVSLTNGESEATAFYGTIEMDCPKSNVKLAKPVNEFASALVNTAWEVERQVELFDSELFKDNIIVGESLTAIEVNEFFCEPSERRFEENREQELLSFFYGDNHYVTLQEKEVEFLNQK